MIIKVKPRKTPSFGQLLNYMMAGRGKGKERSEHDFIHTHNLQGREVAEWIREFEENETFRLVNRSDSNILTHEIMSWHQDDTTEINREMLEDITREYISHRGLEGMYVAVPHFDKAHVHIHLAVSGVEYRTGKSMRMSKAQFNRLKSQVQEYQIQKYPQLEHSVVGHGRATGKPKVERLKSYTEQQKSSLEGITQKCYRQAKSMEEFKTLLVAEGLNPYYRNGRITGVHQGNRKYRLRKLGLDQSELSRLDDRQDRQNRLRRSRTQEDRPRSRSLDRDDYEGDGGFGGSTPEQDAS